MKKKKIKSCIPGPRASPLIRRQSFPTYFTLNVVADDAANDSPPRSPRRPSDNDSSTSPGVHRRTRLIRRH